MDGRSVTGGPGRGTTREALVALGSWPRVTAQILRARLETAGIDVFAEATDDVLVALAVPADRVEFARAVVHEIDVDDEVPDSSPFAYVARIEEHLWAVGELLEELRARLDELERRRGSA
jgi:hypothetical protein